jgi:penicillin-binding protein 2
LDPEAMYYNPGYFRLTPRARPIDDTAPPGNYNFREAFKHSSNTYFIEYGLRAGAQRLIALGNLYGLGERTGIVGSHLEVGGYFPDPGQRFKKNGDPWMEGDTANLCIGQGEITVTPLQMAIMTAAVANGGTVYKPRMVSSISGGEGDLETQTFPVGEVVRRVDVNPENLRLVQKAMWADVCEKGGGGTNAFVAGMSVCGKTGTAQVRRTREQGGGMDHVTWFVSYAPFEAPKYAVVVMVESGASGGSACATKVGYIYKQIQKLEQRPVALNDKLQNPNDKVSQSRLTSAATRRVDVR